MEEDLEEFMSQFGDVTYCRLVVDRDTEHPKGIGI
jgi:RNA recognition motif-containing protein